MQVRDQQRLSGTQGVRFKENDFLLPHVGVSSSSRRYKARSYRARSVRDPRAVLKEFGTEIPEDVTIQVLDSNADSRYACLSVKS